MRVLHICGGVAAGRARLVLESQVIPLACAVEVVKDGGGWLGAVNRIIGRWCDQVLWKAAWIREIDDL